MKSIYNCPHCGEKSFNPWTKANAGQLNSKGKPCMNCGRLVVNGEGATIFHAIFSLICFALVILTYLKSPKTIGTRFEWIYRFEVYVVLGLILLGIFVPRIVNAFFFKLAPAIRIEIK